MKTFQQFFIERKSEFAILKGNRASLEGEEKEKAMKSGCVWHFGPGGTESCAIYKSKDTSGKVWYVSNTHRMYAKSKTLDQAIEKWHKEIKPSS